MLEKNADLVWDSLGMVMSEHLCRVPSKDEMDISFVELGANSLMLLEFSRGVEKAYGVRIELRQFFEELSTIEDLCSFLTKNVANDWSPNTENSTKNLTLSCASNGRETNSNQDLFSLDSNVEMNADGTLSNVDRLLNFQINATTKGVSEIVDKQLAFLNHFRETSQNQTVSTKSNKGSAGEKEEILWGLPGLEKRKLNADQAQFLQKLQNDFCAKTKQSKDVAQESRRYFANNRPSLGYRQETKDMFYPITCSKSDGAYLTDIDGNEYIDLALGFGVHLFGHRPKFIYDQINEQVKKGIQIGPQSELTAEVAKLFCEITGNDRVTFYNSGTEAVMTAIRVARAVTGKDKIVIFSGSYHGHADSTLMVSDESSGEPKTQPLCKGVPSAQSQDVIVLRYDETSLEKIEEFKDELAAVIVEPVQSRQPSLQPVAFLQKLKEITSNSEVILVFDEMITGFRIKPGGAQSYFGIKPDLSTYGKIIGGGMPIGCLAGRQDLMSYIDGGLWDYGDESYPKVQKVFTGGTFCNHPLTLRCILAVLERIQDEGEELQDSLTEKTENFAKEINTFFDNENVPIQMVNFGSLFRFVMSNNYSYVYQPLEMDLFHAQLTKKGVFTWEGRTCYFSTAHDEEVLSKLIEKIQESVLEMKEGGFFLKKKKSKVASSNTNAENTFLQSPLSESQKQLWYLYRANRSAFDAYTYSLGLKIKGRVETEVLRGAINELVKNHEALRTSIDENGEFQTVHPRVDVELIELDFSAFTYNKQKEEVEKWFLDQYSNGFELEDKTLYRWFVLKLNKTENLFVMFSHHILMDGISEQVVFREIIRNYNALKEGAYCGDVGDSMQLSQYIDTLNCDKHQERIASQKDYWLKKLGDLPLTLNLPVDKVHPAKASYRGARKKVIVSKELSEFIKGYSRQNGCSNFMTWISFYSLWLHKISAQEELAVFTTSSGRYFENTSNMVGYCANPIIVKSQLAHNPTFEDFMKEMKKELLDVFEHQEYPFSKLISACEEALNFENRLPFTALFNMDHIRLDYMEGSSLELFLTPIKSVISDLSLNVTETDDEFILCFDYNKDVFKDESMDRLAQTFISLIENALSESMSDVSNIGLLQGSHLDMVTNIWNETSLDYDRAKTIHELFENQAKENPHRIALVVGNESMTYGELNRKSNQVGHYLIEKGVEPNQPKGLLFDKTVELIVGILGILKSGNAYVPIDTKYPKERVSNIIDVSSISFVLTMNKFKDAIPEETNVIAIDQNVESIAQQSDLSLDIRIQSDHLCYVINTSGSTGLPKSVGLRHENITNVVDWYMTTNQIRPEDRVFLFTSICFDLTQKNIYTALSSGAQLHLSTLTIYDPNAIARYIRNARISWITCTPSVIAPMIESASEDKLRYVYLGGEVARKSIFKNWMESKVFNAMIVNTYGPTECSDIVTIYNISKADLYKESEFPIGKPVPNLKVYILDQHLNPQPIGVVGEICIAGEGVSSGYLNDAEKTNQRFIDNPFSSDHAPVLYRTGDLGKFKEDGNIEIAGRNDNQVKVRGFRIELEEIESVIIQHELISNVVVNAETTEGEENRLVGFLSLNKERDSNVSISSKDIRDFIKSKLPEYMVPERFIVLESFNLTSNGKIDRKQLNAASGVVLDDFENAVPENEVEVDLVELCKELLELDRIGVNSNFFESGGHSLKVVRLVSILEDRYGIQLSLKDMFNAGTIRKIAALIRSQIEGGISNQKKEFLDISKEAELEDQIRPLPEEPSLHPKVILLTGATGFVGRFLLRQLLDDYEGAVVYCLVRAENVKQASRRLEDVLSKWDLLKIRDLDRVKAIPADISKPNLGMKREEFNRLTNVVDSIYHCASRVNHFENFASAKAANVDSVEALLRIATTQKPKTLNYMSTLSIFTYEGQSVDRVVEESTPLNEERHEAINGYEASKWVAEKLIGLAQERSVPCNIFRLGLVWADSVKGRFDSLQREYRILESCVQSGFGLTDYKYEMTPVPVDFVAKAISMLSKINPNGGQVFHLGGSASVKINIHDSFQENVNAAFEPISTFDWIKEVKSMHMNEETLPAVPFVEHAFSMDEISFEESLESSENESVVFNSIKTQSQLQLMGLEFPKFDQDLVGLALSRILEGRSVVEEC